ncbi:MAG TPA: class I SAM-dependent methyltransferase [Spirochaetota bacterium]|nr:class I SAM-dependent methyltransferase [Spirochaetota bacterium]
MIKDFWEEKHREESKLSLSGHPGPTVLSALNVVLTGKMKVLEIGVGLGYCTRYIANMGIEIHCVDIAQAALNRVKDIAKTYLAENIGNLPENYFDRALSLCVTQHIDDAELKKQLGAVIKSLREDGIFAMQFSFPFYGARKEQSEAAMQNGECARPIETMYEMIEAAGGKVKAATIMGVYPLFKSGWCLVHIGKK